MNYLVGFDLPKDYSREVFRITPALTAKHRLQAVIAADRSAVPCGRWVRIERPIRIPKLDGWLGIFPATRAPLWRTYRPVKPRYRYEVRR